MILSSDPLSVRAGATGDPSLVELLSVLLRRRMLVVRVTLLMALAGATLALLSTRTYSADFSFTPQESSASGGLSAIASDFGVNIAANAAQSPEFYQNLLHTREILWKLLDSKFTVPTASGPVTFTLLDSMGKQGKTPGLRRQAAAKLLSNDITARIDQKTSIVSVSVKTWSPVLALQMSERVVDAVNQFNTDTRRSRAAAQRQFAEQRLAEARVALRNVEDRETSWGIRNKIFSGSPELLFEKSRLDRELTLRDNEYVATIQQFNSARMEEVRNTPVITIVEKPTLPAAPDPRGLVTKTVLGGFLGFVLATLLAFLFESLRKSHVIARDELSEFSVLRSEVAHEIRHPLTVVRKLFSLRSSQSNGSELH